MTKNIIIGTGPLGLAIMDELTRRGEAVTLINRRGAVREKLPALAKTVAGDVTDPEVVRRLCKGAQVVYFCAMPAYTNWAEGFPPLALGVIRGLANSKVRVVYADNLYMYGPTGGNPLYENLPYNARSIKGRTRAQVARMFLEAREKGELDVFIARGADFFGPRVTGSTFGKEFFLQALTGKPVNLIGNPALPHSITYIGDFARVMICLGENKQNTPAVFHVPNDRTLSKEDFVAILGRERGKKLKTRAAGKFLISLLGLFNPMIKEIKEMMYQWEEPFVVDHSLFLKTFAFQPTPFEQSVKKTAAWYKEQYKLV